MRPTLKAALLLLAGVPVGLFATIANDGLWALGVVWLGTVLLLSGIDALAVPGRRAVRVSVTPPAVLHIGDPGTLAVDVGFQDRRGAEVEVHFDTDDILDVPPRAVCPVPAGRRGRVEVPLAATRRGTARVDRVWLRWRGPRGLASHVRVIELGGTVPVVPNLRAVTQAAMRFTARDAPHGERVQHEQGDGSEFKALRGWVPGFDTRSIDWKQSAKHRSLICKEFEAERNHQILLAFDTGYLMSEPLEGVPKLDRAINAGLLIAWASLKGGDRVGIFGFDARVRHYSRPIGGARAFDRLHVAAAQLDYHAEETNFTLGLGELLGNVHRRSLVIVMSDFVDTVTAELMLENVGRLATRHLVLFVTLRDPALDVLVETAPVRTRDLFRAVVADDFAKDRRVVLERLRRLGVHCLECGAGDLNTRLLNRYLTIKRLEQI